jgi:hypothetical protein
LLLAKKGIKQFQDELGGLYYHVIIDKNPHNYFNASISEKFKKLCDILKMLSDLES